MHVADLLRVKADLIDIQHYSPWITLRVLYNPKHVILVTILAKVESQINEKIFFLKYTYKEQRDLEIMRE